MRWGEELKNLEKENVLLMWKRSYHKVKVQVTHLKQKQIVMNHLLVCTVVERFLPGVDNVQGNSKAFNPLQNKGKQKLVNSSFQKNRKSSTKIAENQINNSKAWCS